MPTYWALAVLMFAGLVLRVTQLGVVPYHIDEAALSIVSSQIANLKSLPLVGIRTSFGFHNPPLFVYGAAPLALFTPDPRFGVFMFGMLGSAAIGLTGLTARRLWGGWATIVAAAIVCFAPTAIEHSRRLWGHDTMIFWSALATYCTVRSIQTQRRRWSWTALAAAACAQACHLSGVLLWVFPVGALLLFRPRNWRASLGIGAAMLLLIYLPWMLYDMGIGRPADDPARNFDEIRTIVALAAGKAKDTAALSPAPAAASWIALLSDSGATEILSREQPRFLAETPVVRWLHPPMRLLLGVMMAGGAIALAWQAWALRRTDTKGARWAALLAASAFAPMVLFTLLPVTTVPAYQLPALVPGALGAAMLLTRGRAMCTAVPWREARTAAIPRRSFAMLTIMVAAIALYGATYTRAARQFVAHAAPTDQVASVLDFKLDAIAYVARTATTEDYMVMQDGRAPEVGTDFWALFLHFYLTGDPRVPWNPIAREIFVIVENRTVLREPLAEWLADKEPAWFGTLAVYHLTNDEAAKWRDLTRRYPSRRPE